MLLVYGQYSELNSAEWLFHCSHLRLLMLPQSSGGPPASGLSNFSSTIWWLERGCHSGDSSLELLHMTKISKRMRSKAQASPRPRPMSFALVKAATNHQQFKVRDIKPILLFLLKIKDPVVFIKNQPHHLISITQREHSPGFS